MSANKSRFDIWTWLEKHGQRFIPLATILPVTFILLKAPSVWVVPAMALLVFVAVIPPFIIAKRSEAARKQEEQRELKELDEMVNRLHGNSQGAR